MYKGRLFTFGCSFTQYNWPTWADLLGREFEEYYNYGMCGGGNLFMSCSVAEAVARKNISSDDTVMVMWTNVTREDRYTDRWICPGNIYTQAVYSEEFVKNFITIRGCYIKDMAQIYLVDKLLEKIGCKYEFMSMVDMNNNAQYSYKDSTDEVKDILELYAPTLKKFKPSVHRVVFNCEWGNRPILDDLRLDPHPLPLEHIEYINHVLPEYEFSNDTLEFAKLHDLEARNALIRRHNSTQRQSNFEYRLEWNRGNKGRSF